MQKQNCKIYTTQKKPTMKYCVRSHVPRRLVTFCTFVRFASTPVPATTSRYSWTIQGSVFCFYFDLSAKNLQKPIFSFESWSTCVPYMWLEWTKWMRREAKNKLKQIITWKPLSATRLSKFLLLASASANSHEEKVMVRAPIIWPLKIDFIDADTTWRHN